MIINGAACEAWIILQVRTPVKITKILHNITLVIIEQINAVKFKLFWTLLKTTDCKWQNINTAYLPDFV